jgi:hypothetical protein
MPRTPPLALLTHIQDKKVTIVQGDRLLTNDAYPDKFRKALDVNLRSRGIDIIYDDFVDEYPEAGVVGVTTRNGRKIDADLVVSAFASLSML